MGFWPITARAGSYLYKIVAYKGFNCCIIVIIIIIIVIIIIIRIIIIIIIITIIIIKKDQPIAYAGISIIWEPRSILTLSHLHKQKTVTKPECQGKQVPDPLWTYFNTARSLMWYVRCKLCLSAPGHRYSAIGNTLKHSMATRKQRDWPPFQSSEKM